MSVQVQVTQFGLGLKAGGWDGASDSGTDAWLGNRNNTLNMSSCALSKPAEEALGQLNGSPLKGGELLRIYFDVKHIYYRTFDDRTDQTLPNARVDFFFPYAFDKTVPDSLALVTVV